MSSKTDRLIEEILQNAADPIDKTRAFVEEFYRTVASQEGFLALIREGKSRVSVQHEAVVRIDNGKPSSYGYVMRLDLEKIYGVTEEKAAAYGRDIAEYCIKRLRQNIEDGVASADGEIIPEKETGETECTSKIKE